MTLFNLQRFSGLKSIINGTVVSDADEAVAQNVSTANSTYPILLTPTANATTNQGNITTIFGKGVKVNPSTSVISATGFSGSTASIGAATISGGDIKIGGTLTVSGNASFSGSITASGFNGPAKYIRDTPTYTGYTYLETSTPRSISADKYHEFVMRNEAIHGVNGLAITLSSGVSSVGTAPIKITRQQYDYDIRTNHVKDTTYLLDENGYTILPKKLTVPTISSRYYDTTTFKINDVPLARSWYGGACSTAGGTNLKELTIPNFNFSMDLVDGAIISFFLSNDHTGGNVSLSINGTAAGNVLTGACRANGSYNSITYLSGTTAKKGFYSVIYLKAGLYAFFVLKKPE